MLYCEPVSESCLRGWQHLDREIGALARRPGTGYLEHVLVEDCPASATLNFNAIGCHIIIIIG